MKYSPMSHASLSFPITVSHHNHILPLLSLYTPISLSLSPCFQLVTPPCLGLQVSERMISSQSFSHSSPVNVCRCECHCRFQCLGVWINTAGGKTVARIFIKTSELFLVDEMLLFIADVRKGYDVYLFILWLLRKMWVLWLFPFVYE